MAGVNFVALLAGQAINPCDVALGVAVLSGLGDLDVNNFARAALEHDVGSLLAGVRIDRSGEGSHILMGRKGGKRGN